MTIRRGYPLDMDIEILFNRMPISMRSWAAFKPSHPREVKYSYGIPYSTIELTDNQTNTA